MPRVKKTTKKQIKTEKLKTEVYDTNGTVVGKIILPERIFAAKANPALVAQAVRVYLANQRQGTLSTKTRSEVTGSSRKIYRQKGTGRARHGDIKAPIFRGGGVAHGPKTRDFRLVLPKKMQRAALFGVISGKLALGNIKIVRGMDKIATKTKELVGTLSKLNLLPDKKNKILILTAKKLLNVYLASRNIPYVSTKPVSELNTYEVLSHHNLLFTEEGAKAFKK